MKPKFEFWRSKKDDQWYFRLVAGNGEVVAASEGYVSRDGCLNGIQAVKDIATGAEVKGRDAG